MQFRTMRSPLAHNFNLEDELALHQQQDYARQQESTGFMMPQKQPFSYGMQMPEQDIVAPLTLKNQFDSDFSRPYNMVPAHSEIKCIRDPVSNMQKENNSTLVPSAR